MATASGPSRGITKRRPRKSKKRFGTKVSRRPKLPDTYGSPVYFLDATNEARGLADVLRESGRRVWLHKEVFDDPETPDYIWLPEIAKRGWVVITKDAALLRNAKQLSAWYRSGAKVFVFTGGNASGERMIQALLKAIRRMERIIADTDPPFLIAVHLDGSITPYQPSALSDYMLHE